MEEERTSHRRRPPLLSVVLASFILGSFSGAAFGVLFALTLDEHRFFRDLADVPSEPRAAERVILEEDRLVIDAARKAAPSVVSINVFKDVSSYPTGPDLFYPFDEFFEIPPPPADGPAPRRRRVGGGTGFIISADGLILTNRHVVQDDDAEYEVVMNDGASHDARVLAKDPILDLAVLKIAAEGLPVPELGNSDELEIGQTVIAIGNALSEYRNTVTKGVVSGVGRRVVAGDGFGSSEVLEEAIQTDAAINPGNSGGPLVDIGGRVVGVNTAVNRSGQSIGFAIPINVAKLVIESVRETGRIVRPWLGVRYVLVDEDLAAQEGLPVGYGALIVAGRSAAEPGVVPGSPAKKAGIVDGDILLEIDGLRIDADRPLSSLIARHRPGETVRIALMRGEERIMMQVTLGELPESF